MCDEAPGVFNIDDIVWVKLGARWWPGQVRDLNNVPEELRSSFKKDPLLIVQFFDEDSFELVKNWANVYPYNCPRKDEFIKKGMDAFRAKVSHMEKFPKDVSTAEVKTNGNPNILSSPQFAPEKKTNYSALFFGETSTKKKDTPKKRSSQSKTQNKADISHITHRRFLGYNDYEAHIRIQYPGKDREDSKYSDDETTVSSPPRRERRSYTCTICKFETDCLEVIVLHNTSHIQGVYKPLTTSKKPKKSLFKRDKAKKSQKSRSSMSVHILTEASSDEENDSEKKGKRKRKPQGQSKSSKQRKIEEEKPKTASDIRSDLLAEWEDVSDTEENTTQEKTLDESTDFNNTTLDGSTDLNNTTVDESTNLNKTTFEESTDFSKTTEFEESTDLNSTTKTSEILDSTHNSSDDMFDTSFMETSQEITEATLDEVSFTIDKVDGLPKDAITVESTPSKEADTPLADATSESHILDTNTSELNKTSTKSCFDFDEEEEESVGTIIGASAMGRKIPRVIPPTEKRLSRDLGSATPESPLMMSDSDDSNLKRLAQSDENHSVSSTELIDVEKDKSISHSAETSNEGSSCMEKNGVSCGSQENDDHMDSAFSDLLEATVMPELPDIPNTLKCEQNFHSAKTIKFPDKTDPSITPDQKPILSKTSETTNVATKLTNPKKRFVKSFEDFELLQSEQKRIAEEKKDPIKQNDPAQLIEKEESKSCDVEEHLSTDSHQDSGYKLGSQLIGGPAPENAASDNTFENKIDCISELPQESAFTLVGTKTVTEPQIEQSSLKLSTFKTQVMSKLQDAKGDVDKDQDLKYDVAPKVRRTSASHRTPRSKILESYRNEQSIIKPPEVGSFALDRNEELSSKSESFSLLSSVFPESSSESTEGSSTNISKPVEACAVTTEAVPPLKVEADFENASQYCFKKKKYSKLSRALSRDKDDFKLSFDNNESLFGDKPTHEGKDEGFPTSATAEPGVNTLLCSIPLPEEKDLLPEIVKVLDHSLSSKDQVADVKSEDKSEELSNKIVEDIPQSLEIAQSVVSVTDESPITEQITNDTQTSSDDTAKSEEAKLAEQQTATEMEKLFSEDDQSLFSDNITSVAVSETPIIPTTKPEFSSTSELMMELADGDKSSSADEDSVQCLPKSEDSPENKNEQDAPNKIEADTSVDETFTSADETKNSSVTTLNFPNDELPKASDTVKDLVEKLTEEPKPEIATQVVIETESNAEIDRLDDIPLSERIDHLEDSCNEKKIDEKLNEKSEPAKQICSDFDAQMFTPDSKEADYQTDEQGGDGQRKPKEDEVNIAACLSAVDVTPTDRTENDGPSSADESSNTIHFKYASGKDDMEFDISIQTNLSNFTNNDELSALTTLATVSQLKDNIETELMLKKSDKGSFDQVNAETQDHNKVTERCETTSVPASEQAVSEIVHKDESDAKVFQPATNLAPTMTEIIENVVKSDILHSTLMKNRDSSSEIDSKVEAKVDIPEANSCKDVENVTEEPKMPAQEVYPIGPVEIPPKVRELNESSLPVDKNLTVVSEKDLADGQVEITSTATKNPVTLTSFSLDFSDTSSDNVTTYKEPNLEEGVKSKAGNKNKHDVKKSVAPSTVPSGLHPTDIVGKGTVDLNARSSDFNLFTTRKMKTMMVPMTKSTGILDAVCDLEEHIPPQIVCATDALGLPKDLPKLASDMADNNGSKRVEVYSHKEIKIPASQIQSFQAVKLEEKESIIDKSKSPKFIIKSKLKQAQSVPQKANKPIILSEKIIKPVADAESVSVQKITSKRTYQDVEDIDTFIIQKSKKPVFTAESSSTTSQNNVMPAKGGGKAKILQQTIITAAGEIIQPAMNQPDDNVFDINSMPIVLSDDILTPESIEKMPIVLSDALQPDSAVTTQGIATSTTSQAPQIKKAIVSQQTATILNKTLPQTSALQSALARSTPNVKVTKTAPKILQSTTGRLIQHTSPAVGKGNKYIILPQTPATQEAKPILKKTLIKKGQSVVVPASQSSLAEPTGNKIMIVTNQQGQKQRLLLTPSHQKLLTQGSRLTKTIVKGNVIQKSVLAPKAGQTIAISTGASANLTPAKSTSSGLLLATGSGAGPGQAAATLGQFGAVKSIKMDPKAARKIPMQQIPKTSTFTGVTKSIGQQKTVLLKNQHGQTIRKFQNTNEALLEKQVAEQIQAIKASNMKSMQRTPELATYKTPKTALKRSYSKRQSLQEVPKQQNITNQAASTSNVTGMEAAVPPLAPLVTKRTDPPSTLHETKQEPKKVPETEKKTEPQRPLNQLVIQDAMGNQTTITEGQILALPSETVDGQPQSYMLVTLDESGNLTPLNSEALMSLDPNLNLGGDLSNMVLQIDQTAVSNQQEAVQQRTALMPPAKSEPTVARDKITVEKKTKEKETLIAHHPSQVACAKTTLPNTSLKTMEMMPATQTTASEGTQVVTCNVGGEPGQQLIVSGDSLATQKFLESLSDGTTDLANILANTEGGSILIHADGQQILINTDSDNQNLLLSVNTDNVGVNESTEGGGNPIFASQPKKNKDILAAALAGTDVFQQEQNSVQNKVAQSQLSPNSSLYPMNVGNVLEPTLTLSSPIMTPLEVPITNKKIADGEADILSHVPKNVDLPITITDPNISQTVSQQQVASMIANELQSNLDLTLPITDTSMSVATTEINSPSFVYTDLPTFDDGVEVPKSFNSSMPLLTEGSTDANASAPKKEKKSDLKGQHHSKGDVKSSDKTQNLPQSKFDLETDNSNSSDKMASVMHSDGSLMEEEGLCTLGGEMCTSLSEPPPDMFELDAVNSDSIPDKSSENTDGEISQKVVAIDNNDTKEDSVREALMEDDRVTPTHMSRTKPDDASTDVSMVNEDSCEIPILPQIVTDLSSEQAVSGSESDRRNMVQHEGNDNT